MTKQTNATLVKAMINALKDADIRIKGVSLESICAAHLHNDLSHKILTSLYDCRPGQATRILRVLNELVPRNTNEGATEMSTPKKTAATKKPETKKPVVKKPVVKKPVVKKTEMKKPVVKKAKKDPQPRKNGFAQPHTGTLMRKMWDTYDAMVKKLKRAPTRKEAIKAFAKQKDINAVTVGCQYRYWAVFHGFHTIKKRSEKKAPVATKTPAKKTARKLAVKRPMKKAVKRPIAKKVKK